MVKIGNVSVFVWFHPSTNILSELGPVGELELLINFVAVLFSNPRVHGYIVVAIDGQFDNPGSALHPWQWAVAAVAGLSSVE